MRANWGESTELGKNGTELGEHNTVYLVLTEALHGLRPHRCKNSSSSSTAGRYNLELQFEFGFLTVTTV
jgi:hypothetical protein